MLDKNTGSDIGETFIGTLVGSTFHSHEAKNEDLEKVYLDVPLAVRING